jgi:hypothetical protein
LICLISCELIFSKNPITEPFNKFSSVGAQLLIRRVTSPNLSVVTNLGPLLR